ncbi:hypothetical protein [Hoeflea sp. TYP-13]|uniref:hypothetical protein n=1 Tax=Hoeflea sp. TYP-13 TaxID=3230023 RepID=UPI0034C6159E
MTDDRDPKLQALFAEAEEDLSAGDFTANVMNDVAGLKRRALILRLCAGLALVACAWLLAMPLQDAASHLSQGLMTPLIGLENPLLAQLLLPLNNVAFPIALALLGLRFIRRRLFS